MTDWRNEVDSALAAFITVADLAGDPISMSDITVEYWDAPHHPQRHLPAGMMAVYGFWGDGCWLKIGNAGPKSVARYTYQHYHPGSAKSTLAASLAKDPHLQSVEGFDPLAPGAWIMASTHRVNILIASDRKPALLQLLESFLQLRLGPRYEG